MRVKPIFYTVLLSLLVFQSLWNIAAAFCVHEENTQSVNIQHFGHHQISQVHDQHNDQNKKQIKKVSVEQKVASFFADDHSDHLPSYAHIVLNDVHQTSVQAFKLEIYKESLFEWQNNYKSPQLDRSNPPPILSLL